AWYNHFGFWISHSYVIFDYVWLIVYFYQSDKYKSLVFNLIILKSLNSGFYDSVFYFFHQNLIYKRNRRNCSHSSCIKSFVSFSYTLIIFGSRKNFVIFTIG